MSIITGYAAIKYAEANGVTLNKYADPTEDARSGLAVDEAREVAAEDPSRVWVEAHMKAYQVSANWTVLGTYASDSEQGARDMCARDAGYKSEADMVDRLDQPSELEAREVEAPMNDINLEQWSQSHETAEEIAEAIFSLARNPEEAELIWQDPTRDEWLAIWERVTKNGLFDGDDFQWGVSAMGNEYPNA